MVSWLKVFQHLLPHGRAWKLTLGKTLRRFFEGLEGAPEDVREFLDLTYLERDPQQTTSLPEWEDQFGLPTVGLTTQQRRDRLEGTWKALGGQDPQYIQDTLQAAGFDVYVHEWWEPIPAHPIGGSVDGDVAPVARDPFAYLWDGVAPRQFVGCGHDLAYCGGDSAFANSNDSPPGYPLVNKLLEANVSTIGAGHALLYSGGASAASGVTTVSYVLKQYTIPADPTKYPYFLYIGGETFPDQATIPAGRREEFEDLCLKICPAEQWLGILVDYT